MRTELQQRLQEPTTVMAAAEGLTEGQRLLARDIELTKIIKDAKAEQDTVRTRLKELAFDMETGEIKEHITLGPGAIEYAPTPVKNYEYDVAAFVNHFKKDAIPYLDVAAGKVTKAIEIGLIKEEELKGIRTLKLNVRHGTKKVDPE